MFEVLCVSSHLESHPSCLGPQHFQPSTIMLLRKGILILAALAGASAFRVQLFPPTGVPWPLHGLCTYPPNPLCPSKADHASYTLTSTAIAADLRSGTANAAGLLHLHTEERVRTSQQR